ncbi:hypothetical protein PVK06_001786 [Gossypium arboreum]|uniref:Uncharacterized protein n=1 Tax=Gossypium arboreum TaxID=29729 RepID=A0ABR0R208_GOSAR|nr:hypothetical protein PVK06_001786 [Gossypium arboreum]
MRVKNVKVCILCSPSVKRIVYEFYANLNRGVFDSSSKYYQKVFIHGRWFKFGPEQIRKFLNCPTTNNLELDESIDETIVALTNRLHPFGPVKGGKHAINELEEMHASKFGTPEYETSGQEVPTLVGVNCISKGIRARAIVDLYATIEFYQIHCDRLRARDITFIPFVDGFNRGRSGGLLPTTDFNYNSSCSSSYITTPSSPQHSNFM